MEKDAVRGKKRTIIGFKMTWFALESINLFYWTLVANYRLAKLEIHQVWLVVFIVVEELIQHCSICCIALKIQLSVY